MKRTITLSLLVLLTVGIMLPFVSSLAHGFRQSVEISQHRKYRRHSRAWWRRHHARIRQRRAALAHRRSLLSTDIAGLGDLSSSSLPTLPIALANNSNVALKTPISDSAAKLPGKIDLAVVALSRPNPAFLTSRGQNRMLAGVDVADLRRIVIDKMVNSNGWVINDFVREVNGSRVFIVTAHTPRDAKSPEQAWNFYFTEVSGRIYGITTSSPVDSAERMTAEAERLIASMLSSQQSSNR